jgi:hypothetical protein
MTDPPFDPATGRYPRTGRPLLLNGELADRIVQVVAAGNYLKTAAQFCGVSQSTLQAWLARGRAAAAQVAAADPAVLECPHCGADRTAEVRAMEEHNAQTVVPEGWAHRILGPCPACRSGRSPAPWELPPAEVPFLSLLERVTQAETQAEVAAVTHWRRAFADDWRAARDYLGRKRPEQWAAKTTVSISSDEAERRIEAATLEALTSMGIDTDGMDLGALGDLDSLDGGDPPEEPGEP